MSTKHKLTDYKPPTTKTSTGHRVAHFLDWAAKKHPRTLFSKAVVAQAVFGLHRRVTRSSPQVVSIENSTSTARKVLLESYKRDLYTERGIGMRATVDDQDALLNPYRLRCERADAAVRHVQLSAANIDINKVPTTEQTKALKSSFRDIAGATSSLVALTKKLKEQLALPPKA